MIGLVILAVGLFLLFVGGLGHVRFPDAYARLQAAGVGDVGGAALVLLGLIAEEGWTNTGGLMVVLLLFLVFTVPLSTHAVAKGAFVRRQRPWEG